jgi:DNA-binding transcriptional ArsR family regulator
VLGRMSREPDEYFEICHTSLAELSNDLSLMGVLQALADPIRLEIVRQLDESGQKACGMFGIDMPKSSLSHHFRILRESGVIISEGQDTIFDEPAQA